ncbi:MAG: metal ABC transporter permease [Burkholderiaceae bacterium]|jgi:zinc/manganese transport system permease protein
MELWYALPALALVAGAAALVPLGQQVLQRGVVFIDLAVAQAAAAGSLWGMVLLHQGEPPSDGLIDVAGLIGSLLCAGAVAAVSRRWPERREALIGLLYVVFACLTLLGARMDAHGRDRMLELLAADVLWAQAPPVQVLAAAAALLLGLLAWRPELLTRDAVFYSVFAVMVSLAVPVLGLFVVFGLLIGPALWMRREEHRSDLWLGITTGAGAALSGLVASWWWDAPSGPSVALACALLGLGALVRRSAD